MSVAVASTEGGLQEAAEITRYGALHASYQKLPFNVNKVARTGWTRPIPGYKVAFFGNSKEDWMKIIGCFFALYSGLALFFWGLLEFYLATQHVNGALWIFLALGVVAWCTLGVVVKLGNEAREEAAAAVVQTKA